MGRSGISLSSLIELFSRKPGPDDPHWMREVGPLRLADLRRTWPGSAKRVNRLRNRLILIFLAATLAPLLATVWITTSLLEFSLDFSSTTASWTLFPNRWSGPAREFYQRARDDLKQQARLRPGALRPGSTRPRIAPTGRKR